TLNETIRRRKAVCRAGLADGQTVDADPALPPGAQPSLLCIPVLLHDRLAGVASLENPFPDFTPTGPILHTLNIILRHLLRLCDTTSARTTVLFNDVQLASFCSRFGCTPAESRVLALVLKGLTNKQIGERLFSSFGTVRTHLNRIYQKTETGGREALGRLFEAHCKR
ncbi:MAG TPA: LuxR family transcriptional regulator, partial [Spirochaetia bacterium]|nr:LuxR family transcriptional regulator [Spirochaetia bacterium]